MHALPIALPARLLGQISHATAEMKNYLDAAIPSELRGSIRSATYDLWGGFHFDKTGFRKFTLSLNCEPANSFAVRFEGETFSNANDSVKRQVVAAWLEIAVKRRMDWGRELAHVSDDTLENRAFCNLIKQDIHLHDHIDLQEAFLFRLREAERELRKTPTSTHAKLDAIKGSGPLLKLLDYERQEAEGWARTASHVDKKLPSWSASKVPEELHLVYAYRNYHMERRAGFPLFDIWGEPWQGVRSKEARQ